MTAADQSGDAAEAPLYRFIAEYGASKLAVAGLAVTVLIVSAALLAPWISAQNPYDLMEIDIMDGRLPPGSRSASGMVYWLGTDDQGRDMLSAILYGLRVSLAVAAGSAFVALLLGTMLGLIAASMGGRVDTLLMRIVDLQLSFPAILVGLMILAFLGRGVLNVMIALVLVEWAYHARTVRAAAMVEMRREYIEAAKSLALPSHRIVIGHLLPNCLAPIIVIGTIQVARAITLEASLSFLGLGVPITQPSLGLRIANGSQFLLSGVYWMSFFPGVALLLTLVGFNLVGDRVREILNPRAEA